MASTDEDYDRAMELVYWAWVIIGSAYEHDWNGASEEWREAAHQWQKDFHQERENSPLEKWSLM